MVELVGGTSRSFTRDLPADTDGRDEGPVWTFEAGEFWIRARLDPVDPKGWTVWDDGTRAGLISGVLTNLDELGLSHSEVFERLLDGDDEVASAINGGFLIVCLDQAESKVVLVADKLGARPCYYFTDDGLWFADAVSALVPGHPAPTVDRQAVSDMLLMGNLWGDRTMVDGIRAIRPATITEVVDGSVSTERYWKPDFSEASPGTAYIDELATRYRQAASRATTTLPASPGLWLSGGLDSRTTVAALLETIDGPTDFESLGTYTYDANPPTNDNPRIARLVAHRLGIENDLVPLTADTFGEVIEHVIDVTDGQIQWTILANLSATYNIEHPPPVMMEGMQGALLGDHLLRYHLEGTSVIESQLHSEAGARPDRVADLLAVEVDQLETFRAEAERTTESSYRGAVLETHFQNYYSRMALLSNQLIRDRVGSRVVHADGDYLEWCARLPQRYRKGTFPWSHRIVEADAGGIPYGTSRAKLQLCRRISPAMADIVYERTKTKPSRPYPVHVAGFVGNVVVNKLRRKPTYGSAQLSDYWIRDRGTAVHDFVTRHVDDACDRSLFDGDAVREVYEDHMNGANNASMLSKITTLEYWLQSHLE